jgi:hypothetical protein
MTGAYTHKTAECDRTPGTESLSELFSGVQLELGRVLNMMASLGRKRKLNSLEVQHCLLHYLLIYY